MSWATSGSPPLSAVTILGHHGGGGGGGGGGFTLMNPGSPYGSSNGSSHNGSLGLCNAMSTMNGGGSSLKLVESQLSSGTGNNHSHSSSSGGGGGSIKGKSNSFPKRTYEQTNTRDTQNPHLTAPFYLVGQSLLSLFGEENDEKVGPSF